MGNALLLQWRVLVGMVLSLSLCSTYIRYAPNPRPYTTTTSHPNADFVGVDKMSFPFELGKPFRPFEQLMGVLPEASKGLVPLPYRVSVVYFSHRLVFYTPGQSLMCDINSPILHFYPKKIELDMNGKKHPWEAIVKIPFIHENQLLQAMACMFYFFVRF